jgi:hypothetical protein
MGGYDETDPIEDPDGSGYVYAYAAARSLGAVGMAGNIAASVRNPWANR